MSKNIATLNSSQSKNAQNVPKTHRFFRHSTCKYTVTLKPGLGSLKVIENNTIQSGTHHFLLTSHSNHRPISHRFRDKRRFPSEIANFPTPCVFNAPRWRGSLGIGYRSRVQKKLEWWGYQMVEKDLDRFSCLNTIPACDIQPVSLPASQPRCRSIIPRLLRRAGKQETHLMLTKPRDAFRGQSRSPNIVPFHMLGIHTLVQYSNFVFSDIRLQKMSWPWNPSQRSLNVIESGIIR